MQLKYAKIIVKEAKYVEAQRVIAEAEAKVDIPVEEATTKEIVEG